MNDNYSYFQPGDLVACYGTDKLSRAIMAATFSLISPRGLRVGPSHIGIVARVGEVESAMVESTTLSGRDCIFAGEPVSGIQAAFPWDRVNDYISAGGKVDVYRPTEGNALNEAEAVWLSETVNQLLHNRIEYDYIGAGFSGTRLLSALRLFNAKTDRLFCSELCSFLLQSLGLLNRRNPSRHSPARLLRELVRTGVYSRHSTLTLENVT